MQRTILVLTSDLNIMSIVGALPIGPSVVLRCVPTIPMLSELVAACTDADLCVITCDEHADVRSCMTHESARLRPITMIGLVEHPFPDIVQQLRLQGIQHVIKRDALPALLASITKDL